MRASNPSIDPYVGIIALYKVSTMQSLWVKTQSSYKHLYTSKFSTDGQLVITTTCCLSNQFFSIYRASDGVLLKAANYPLS